MDENGQALPGEAGNPILEIIMLPLAASIVSENAHKVVLVGPSVHNRSFLGLEPGEILAAGGVGDYLRSIRSTSTEYHSISHMPLDT